MKQLESFIENILNKKEGYSLGKPWKHSKDSMGVIIPILCDGEKKRDYVIYPEVKDKVHITDTGAVSILNVVNKADDAVFIRSGTMFEGIKGQDRSIISSIIVEPNGKTDIHVRCVHASRPTYAGGGFKYGGYVPPTVHSNLYRGQRETWGSVQMCASRMETTSGEKAFAMFSDDDLPKIKENQMKFDKNIQAILEEVPVFENQIGAIIISMKGIVGLESFNHPDSWKAQYKEAISNYSEELSVKAKDSLFTFDEKNVDDVVNRFLSDIKNAVLENINETSSKIIFKGYIGEVAIYNDHIVHLFVMKDDEKENEKQTTRPTTGISFGSMQSSRPIYRGAADYNFMTKGMKKGFAEVSQAIEKHGGEATWSEIEGGLKQTTLSTSTISSRLKEGRDIGLFSQDVRKTNGKKVYKIQE
jgi:hypothetical protein